LPWKKSGRENPSDLQMEFSASKIDTREPDRMALRIGDSFDHGYGKTNRFATGPEVRVTIE
jgi:hypothetical protein